MHRFKGKRIIVIINHLFYHDKFSIYFLAFSLFFQAAPKVIEAKGEGDLPGQARRCAHFYACICAFASDPKLSDEFRYYINLDQMELRSEKSLSVPFQPSETDKIIGMDIEGLSDDTHFLIFRDDTLTVQNLDGSRLDIDSINLDATILPNNIVDGIDVDCAPAFLNTGNSIITHVDDNEIIDQSRIINISSVKNLQDGSTKYNESSNRDYLEDNQTFKLWNAGSIGILDKQGNFNEKNVKLLNSESTMLDSSVQIINNTAIMNYESGVAMTMQMMNTIQPSSTKRKRDEILLPNNLSINNLNSIETRKGKTKTTIIKKYQNSGDNLDESNANLSFIKWLGSITERINQTMHFQFDGKPEPLVFHVPQIFFDCLRERISCGGKKKRLPNSTTAFIRKDGVPLGTFTKYTWQITNILHIKSIFDTPMIPLEITRSFLQNSDGTYELYKREESDIDRYKKSGNNALIKPLELKTYLKVGNTCPNQLEPTPFLIEWIPDILPISKIGELRLRFEFGHVKSEASQKFRKVALAKNYS
uniref:C2orf42_1 protein n=1 Tax=Fopius arisanus TaxID=64838 RepID=A0A0C9R994_9HYME